MKKWNRLETTQTPDGSEMTLWEHDGVYVIRIGGLELMSTRQHASEEELAQIACSKLPESGARVLIGGLGFGFTLSAALSAVPKDAQVVVAELIEDVIHWNSNPDYPLASKSMADPRVSVLNCDVLDVIEGDAEQFDAVLLDVDNGPSSFTDKGNNRLYSDRGLRSVGAALRPGGVAAFWSSVRDDRFASRLDRIGFDVDVRASRAHANSGKKHVLYFARPRS